MSPSRGPDPFATLGLPAGAGLTDDEVRAAWRRVAAATHPDRADGGDPARFAAAAAAYTVLRTRSGRGEALADLAAHPGRGGPGAAGGGIPRPGPHGWRARARPGALLARVRRGRPAVLALRLAAAAAVAAGAVIVAGWAPATPAVITGAVTWLVLTARRDLAPPS
jgi:DnaJ domain